MCYTDTILANSEFNFKYPLNPLNKCSKKVKSQVVESISLYGSQCNER